MPPRTRAAARSAEATFHSLPQPLALRIFALLPVDARLRAAAVCRAWRAVLAERSLWTRLDLADGSGVARPSRALLRAAASRAGGQLEFLRLHASLLERDVLLAVLAESAETMRELKLVDSQWLTEDSLDQQRLGQLLNAAPRLRLLEAALRTGRADALAVLRKEQPFGPVLRLTGAHLTNINMSCQDIAEGLAAHKTLESVVLGLLFFQEEPGR